MCADELLSECIIAFGNRAGFVNPRCGAALRYNGDFVCAARSRKDVRELTDDVFLVQRGNERVLEFVRYKVAAFGIRADAQRVSYFDIIAPSCVVPERSLVCVRCPAGFRLGLRCFGFCRKRRVHGFVEFVFKSLCPFHTSDFFAQCADFVFHARVDSIVLYRERAIAGSVRVKECLCGFPCFCAFFTQFQNSHFLFLQFLIFHKVEPFH